MALESSYTSPDQRMIQEQARRITKLNEDVTFLRKKAFECEDQMRSYEKDAQMWRKVAKMVKENPALQSIWDDFVVAMKMIDEEKTIPDRGDVSGYHGGAWA